MDELNMCDKACTSSGSSKYDPGAESAESPKCIVWSFPSRYQDDNYFLRENPKMPQCDCNSCYACFNRLKLFERPYWE